VNKHHLYEDAQPGMAVPTNGGEQTHPSQTAPFGEAQGRLRMGHPPAMISSVCK